MTLAFCIALPLSFILGAACAAKCMQLGLRWSRQISRNEEPRLENPISQAVERHKAEKAKDETSKAFHDYFYGDED